MKYPCWAKPFFTKLHKAICIASGVDLSIQFGGLHAILVGDFMQFPPVADIIPRGQRRSIWKGPKEHCKNYGAIDAEKINGRCLGAISPGEDVDFFSKKSVFNWMVDQFYHCASEYTAFNPQSNHFEPLK